jgi:hypothetical protein
MGMKYEEEYAVLSIGNSTKWSFLNGPWSDGAEGELITPDGAGKEYIAVVNDREYADFHAKFRFKFRQPHGGVQFLFRIQDSMSYYALDVPWCGQQNRNRHFWAGIIISEGTALKRYLHLGLVHGICPEHNRWYEAQIQCHGTSVRAWIDGRPVADVEDHTYSSGRVGLMGIITAGHGTPHFADLRLKGNILESPSLEEITQPPEHWITPCREVDTGTFQSYPNIIQSKSGALTASIPFGNPNAGEVRRTVWVRSTDGGRTWSDAEPATLPQGFGSSYVKNDGTWVCIHAIQDAGVEKYPYAIESRDEGKTWSKPKPLNISGTYPEDFALPAHPSGQILRLRNGTLLLPVYCQVSDPPGLYKASTNFVFRSDDDGETWTAPVRCDNNNAHDPDRWFCPGDFSEIGLAETIDNVVLGFGRPGPWPYMWQIQSNDGGKSWNPAAFGSFPGYCISLTRTANGALVAIHRFPYISANVSYDNGLTWDAGTILDYPIWANHKAIEVEPDVILLIYMGHIVQPGQADNRILRLRVTENGLVMDN